MQELLIVAGAHLLAVMSPGPDFALVLKTAIVNGRRAGIFTSIGVGLAILIHVAYSVAGIALLISQSILVFNIIKILGALYLIWIGVQALRSQKSDKALVDNEKIKHKNISDFKAFQNGLVTNALNPKATLFFLSLFTQVINPGTSNIIKAAYGIEMSLATMAWFSLVAVVMTHKTVQKRFVSIRHYIDRTFGVLLIGLGLKIALDTE